MHNRKGKWIKIIALIVSVLFVAEACLILNPETALADIYRVSNTGGHEYSGNWSNPSYSYLIETADGGYLIFEGNRSGDEYLVEYYSPSFELISSRTVAAELSRFGAFYSDGDYYYVLSGQNNMDESPDVECYRLTKYDHSWKRLADCGLKDCDTTSPFAFGSAYITSSDKYLIIRTCRLMYTSSDGLRHQANISMTVDTESMSIRRSSHGYFSHSFNQYVKIDGTNIIGADHGDAYPRAVGITNCYNYLASDLSNSGQSEYSILKIYGDIGNNYTGATLGGLEISDSSYIVVGSSIDQSGKSTSKTENIFVGTVNKTTKETSCKWLTSYGSGEENAGNPYIVKINNDKFAVIWSRDSKVYYTYIDGEGNKNGKIYSAGGNLSDCEPILSDGKILWYTYNGKTVEFYSIDVSSGAFKSFKPYVADGWKQTGGKYYYYKNQDMVTGWLRDGKYWYYMQPHYGYMVTGWQYIDDEYYYMNDSGAMMKGWQCINGIWYYFDGSGARVTGWLKYQNDWYYLSLKDGSMAKGWIETGDEWYYFIDSGVMVTGWKNIKGQWYYFDATGEMLTGWVKSGATWYYLKDSGEMAVGWLESDGEWYYLESSGAMVKGWKSIGGTWYYFNDSGEMVTGSETINGVTYRFNLSGAWIG